MFIKGLLSNWRDTAKEEVLIRSADVNVEHSQYLYNACVMKNDRTTRRDAESKDFRFCREELLWKTANICVEVHSKTCPCQ